MPQPELPPEHVPGREPVPLSIGADPETHRRMCQAHRELTARFPDLRILIVGVTDSYRPADLPSVLRHTADKIERRQAAHKN